MKFHLVAALFLIYFSSASAAEIGYTARATELKKEPFIDAPTVAALPEKSKVDILARQGGWLQVKSEAGGSGWIRMLSLRMGPDGEKQKGDSGLKSLFNVAHTGTSRSTVTTGVRGLSEEDLKNAKPAPQELEKMHRFVAGKPDAQKFAENGGLNAHAIEYMAAPRPAK
ncbi:MAG TPA: hypothetical protein VK138_07930 [Acidiferrobacterales bacterium]|nr:hypothetical protein [Acidiferrobacterales bacterium]